MGQHRLSGRGARTRTYNIWAEMRRRVRPSYKGAHNYADRGITVDPRWDDYPTFLADMGEAPEGTSLDRIDNDGNYEPGNCRWATQKEQTRNTRVNRWVMLRGQRVVVGDAAVMLGVEATLIFRRVREKGETHQQAVDAYQQRVAA